MKKGLTYVLAFAAISFAFIFAACSNSSNSSGSSGSQKAIFTGTYTGSVVHQNGTRLYCTVVGTGSSYNAKFWTDSSESNTPVMEGNGTYTIRGNALSGSGSDHTIAGTSTDGGTSWAFTVNVPGTGTFIGTISK